MMTFTYVSFLSGLVSWSLPGGADSMFQRMSVSGSRDKRETNTCVNCLVLLAPALKNIFVGVR